MIGILAVVAYGLPALLCARMVAGHIAWRQSDRYKQQKPDGDDWSVGWLIGLMAGLVWPLMGAFYFLPIWRLTITGLRRCAVGAEREAIRRRQREHVERVEREVGLR